MIRDDITIAILAGGRGRRMGRDKAMLTVDGVTLLELIARELRAIGPPLLVVGRERPNGWPFDDVRFVRDEAPGLGPLAGIVAALRAANGDVIAVACDMPMLDRALIDVLIEAARGESAGEDSSRENVAEDSTGDDARRDSAGGDAARDDMASEELALVEKAGEGPAVDDARERSPAHDSATEATTGAGDSSRSTVARDVSPGDREGSDGIVLTLDGSPEPLCSLYRRAALPLLEMRMERGELSLKGAIEEGRFRRQPVPTALAGRLRNLNTPDDLAAYLRERGGASESP